MLIQNVNVHFKCLAGAVKYVLSKQVGLQCLARGHFDQILLLAAIENH